MTSPARPEGPSQNILAFIDNRRPAHQLLQFRKGDQASGKCDETQKYLKPKCSRFKHGCIAHMPKIFGNALQGQPLKLQEHAKKRSFGGYCHVHKQRDYCSIADPAEQRPTMIQV